MNINDVKIADVTTIKPVVPQPDNPLRGYPAATFEDISPTESLSADFKNTALLVEVMGIFTPVLIEFSGISEIPRRVELHQLSMVPGKKPVLAVGLGLRASRLIRPGNQTTGFLLFVVTDGDAYYCGIRDGGEIYIRHCWCKIDPRLKQAVDDAIVEWSKVPLSHRSDGSGGGI
jgi:hypothetical protein